jgi:acyl-CoA ligase (AMP-forming) (exosortase A-associated)
MQVLTLPLDHVALTGAPDAPALVVPGRLSLTFAELELATGRLAAWLGGLGLPTGSRIAAWLPKTALAAVLPLATARAGHVFVPINPLLKRTQVAHILADSGSAVLIAPASRLALLDDGDVAPTTLIHDAAAVEPVMTDPQAPVLGPSACDPASLCEILYTSGSTGRPKGVMLSHANLMLGAEAVAEYLGLDANDRVLCVLPFSFDYGQNQLLSSWRAGACAVPLDYLTPRDVVSAVGRHGVTTLAGVPPLWVQLLEVEWPDAAARSLRRLTNSGGALTGALVAGLRTRFPDAALFAMYGLTEAFRSTYLPPALIDSHPDSMGRAIPHAEILVVRPDGSVTPDDEPGELVHCGPLVAHGYWRDAERTAERFRPAPAASRYGGLAVWSGDTVRRDADGLLYFVGRSDAMIKSAGNRISPTEIEEAATRVPGIIEAVAIGVPDARLGQAIRLIVRTAPDDGAAIERLQASLRAELPNFMQPRDIMLRAELPRNPNGKIDRARLIEEDVA